MFDPYRVLGVSPNATDDEVKKAYRTLSREYHPDSHVNKPDAEQAAQKFREVQDAYNQIMDERKNGKRGSYYGNAGAGSSSYYGESATEMNAAANFINNRRYQEALNVLNGINNRDARWYYYSAVANAGIGNNVQAMNDANTAVNMDPNNTEYRNFLNQLQWRTNRYQGMGQQYGNGGSNSDTMCDDLGVVPCCYFYPCFCI